MFEYTTFKDVFSILKSASDIRESVNTTILAKKAEVFDKIKTVRDSVLISKFCIGKIGHFNKREKENGLAHEI